MIRTSPFVRALLTVACMPPIFADDLTPIADEQPSLGRPVSFETDIRPILAANCLACHNTTTAESELNLESVETMLKGGLNGPAIVPGKPAESLLWKLARRGEEPVMPPLPNDRQAKQLTPAELGLLTLWITEGATSDSAAARAMNWQPVSPDLHGVYALDLDQTGRFIAAGRANRVTIYDLANREQQRSLADPAISPAATQHDFVHAVAFHPTQPIVATSGFRNVKFWERRVASATLAATLPAETTVIATTPDSSTLLAAVPGVGLACFDTATGAQRGQVGLDGQPVSAVMAYQSEPRWIVAATGDQRIVVIRPDSLEIAQRTEPLPSAVIGLSDELEGARVAALLADGSLRIISLAADSGAAAVGAEVRSDAGSITRIMGQSSLLVSVAGPRVVQTWNPVDGAPGARFELPADISEAAMNAAMDRAVFVLADGRAVVWSLKESREVAALTSDLMAIRALKREEARRAMLDQRVAVAKSRIDEADKDVAAQKDADTKAKAELDKQIPLQAEAQKKLDEATAKTAEARKALEAKADDEALKNAVAEAEKAETAAKEAFTKADQLLTAARKSIDFVAQAITRAEQRLTERRQLHETAVAEAAGAAAAVEQLRPASGTPVTTTQAGLTQDGRFVWTIDAGNLLRLWNATDGTPLDVLPAMDFGSPVVAATTCGADVLVRLADYRVMRRAVFPDWSLLRSIGSENDPASPFVDRVLSLAFSPDGSLLATGGGDPSRSGEVMLWNVSDGSLVRQIPDAHSDTVFGLEFSPDGQLLASAAADKFARVFDVATGAAVRAFEGHTHHVMDVSWKADRTTLVSAGADNAIKVWNAETGEQTRTITTYSRQVTSLQFVGQQDLILSGSGDKRVFLHTPGNGQPAREFPGNADYVYRVAANPEGTLIVSGCEDGTVRIWNAADASVVHVFNP